MANRSIMTLQWDILDLVTDSLVGRPARQCLAPMAGKAAVVLGLQVGLADVLSAIWKNRRGNWDGREPSSGGFN